MAPRSYGSRKRKSHRDGWEAKDQGKGDSARLGYIPELEDEAHALVAEQELLRLDREYKDNLKREAEEAAAATAAVAAEQAAAAAVAAEQAAAAAGAAEPAAAAGEADAAVVAAAPQAE